jgi:hypothetical protein
LLTYVEGSAAIRSGIAIANPSSTPVNVTLEVNGLAATVAIPANGQKTLFLDEVPGLEALPASFQTVLRVTSPIPVAMTALRGHINERGEFLITTTNPLDESALDNAPELFFPHFAEGAGYSTQFVLFGRNTSGTLYLFDQAGNPTTLVFR